MSDKKPNPVGRPTLYNPKYCQDMIEFFDRDYTQVVDNKKEAVNFPSFAGFARKLKISKSTLYKWAEEHKEFSDILLICKGMQEDILLSNSLKGSYHAGFSQFLLKNTHGFKDKHEVEQKTEERRIVEVRKSSE